MEIEKSSIYTRGGDKGKTSLLGGRRVPKYHNRIEAYGTIDELMAQTAVLLDMVEDKEIQSQLRRILDRIMSAASVIAADGTALPSNMPEIEEGDIEFLEDLMDGIDHNLPPLNSFILPGGYLPASQAHVARTICRRSERMILKLASEEPVDEIIIRFFNRLSDYYFLLSRKLTHLSGTTEIRWKP